MSATREIPPMPPPSDLPIINPEFPGDGQRWPSLPVIRVDAPRKTQAEKYGGLYYLGIAGLFVLLGLIGWFAYGAWSLRDVGTWIYVLHDRSRPETERIQAAFALSRDPRVNQRQLWDMCVYEQGLPPLARYLIAEGLTAEAASADPRGYALTVARSEGWPDWLRLLLLRPLAYRAAAGGTIMPESRGELRGLTVRGYDPLQRPPVASEPLGELRDRPDPIIGLWATFALAVSYDEGNPAWEDLERAAEAEGPDRELAGILLKALTAQGARRIRLLDRATLWVRRHHPGAARLWDGWEVRGDRLVARPAPDLLKAPPGPPGTTSSPAAAER
jgi:hypothetical protein